ncbi:TPA: hypothetical protein DEO28_04825 [Candidatus Dependentiae bacterium]|nr:MAG: hypothetical protein UR14_C0002G0078 [candidate division TM6 bacterium GW2011_GWE2_31_21]KKP53875.1 MAG: hypothetical protein UR43_C0002G0078 [candidate division TM6 bacterium GW2011_GWF2_33_332]HBS47655.1 hypothetical protein [Candidatus Dependentiae bacterium]HBZ73804.1 hypothetical protein [Candidatus Dependentiae bacterium]
MKKIEVDKNRFYEIVKKVVGVLCIIVGIMGLFLPFFQGILLIVIGLILIGNKWLLQKTKKVFLFLKTKFMKLIEY